MADPVVSSLFPRLTRVVSSDPADAHRQLASALGRSLPAAPIGRSFSFNRAILGLGDLWFMTSPGPTTAAHSGVAGQPSLTVARVFSGTYELDEGRNNWRFAAGDWFTMPTAQVSDRYRQLRSDTVFLDVDTIHRLAAEILELDEVALALHDPRPRPGDDGRLWRETVRYVNDGVLRSPLASASPMVLREAARALTVALLQTFRYDTRAEPSRGRDEVEPAVIRRAVECIESRATDPHLDVAAIAEAAGVGVRALQLGFRRHRGTTPLGYLRRVRLDRAHRDLRLGDPTRGDTVSTIAARWGFVSPRHFATQYRARYGCTPRDTLIR